MPLLTVFQSYHSDSSHYSCLSWVSPVLGWALKCLAQGHSHEKTERIQCGLNPGPLDYESNTLPLSHAGPFTSKNQQTSGSFGPCKIMRDSRMGLNFIWEENNASTLSPTSPVFYMFACKSFENTVEKRRNCF